MEYASATYQVYGNKRTWKSNPAYMEIAITIHKKCLVKEIYNLTLRYDYWENKWIIEGKNNFSARYYFDLYFLKNKNILHNLAQKTIESYYNRGVDYIKKNPNKNITFIWNW